MNLTMELDGRRADWNTTVFFDISLPVSPMPSTNAFFLPDATFTAFRAGSFVGSVEQGGPCRCDVVTLAPHGNGTHTECIGHVAGERYSLVSCLRESIVTARLIDVPLVEGTLEKITLQALRESWDQTIFTDALIIRTGAAAERRSRRWSGTNPPYIDVDAMEFLHASGIRHLLVDLPSVDPEEDSGALAAHKMFWQWPWAPRPERTITELICVPDEAPTGLYALVFNAAAFDGDAAPSRPLIHPLVLR
ncbi:MAG TPA: hypothetical protein DIS79_02915 [Bacteroidetes bacterium]|nr:hypothetical protein [Bacteroidota bacterium]HRK05553.1 cyclase family protein [Chlorobiota bacterium]